MTEEAATPPEQTQPDTEQIQPGLPSVMDLLTREENPETTDDRPEPQEDEFHEPIVKDDDPAPAQPAAAEENVGADMLDYLASAVGMDLTDAHREHFLANYENTPKGALDYHADLTRQVIETEAARLAEERLSAHPALKELSEFIDKGGNPIEFFRSFANEWDLSQVDLANKGHQEWLVRQYRGSGDRPLSQSKLDVYMANLKPEDLAEEAKEALATLEKVQAAKFEEAKRRQAQAAHQRISEFQQELSKTAAVVTAAKSQDDWGFLPPPERAQKFAAYFSEVGSDGRTAFQRDWQTNPKLQLQLGYLAFEKVTDAESLSNFAKGQVINSMKNVLSGTPQTKAAGKGKAGSAPAKQPPQPESSDIPNLAFRSFKNQFKLS